MTRHIRFSAIFTLGLVVFGSSCAGKETFDSSQLVSKLKSPAITSTMASEAEKLTSKCMARQGFKYLPLKIVISGKPHEEPGIASPEFLRLHGYGISESISGEMPSVAVGPEILLGHGKDPNKDQVSQLSEADRLAYFTALLGSKAAQSMTSGGFAPLDSTEGCRNQSERAASRNRKASQATLDKGLSNLQRKIENDPKVRSIALTWKKCMAESGYRYDSRFQVINFLNEQAQMIMIGENKPGAIPPGIAQLEKLEFQISATDAACSESNFEALRNYRRNYEDEFANQYRTQIESLLGS